MPELIEPGMPQQNGSHKRMYWTLKSTCPRIVLDKIVGCVVVARCAGAAASAHAARLNSIDPPCGVTCGCVLVAPSFTQQAQGSSPYRSSYSIYSRTGDALRCLGRPDAVGEHGALKVLEHRVEGEVRLDMDVIPEQG
jgi:hypothetical protein